MEQLTIESKQSSARQRRPAPRISEETRRKMSEAKMGKALNTKQHTTKLLREWSARNEKPLTEYTTGTIQKGWWKCSECHHEWQSRICNRTKGTGCPNCKLIGFQGSRNSNWTGYGEISRTYWNKIQRMATAKSRSNYKKKPVAALPFEITIEYAWDLFLKQNRKCALSGELLILPCKRNGKFTGTASLDRIDSTKGYLVGNVQWIDKQFQPIKRNLPDSVFITLCQKVAAYQVEKLGIPSFKKWATKSVS